MIARDDVVTFDQLDGYRTLRSFGHVSGTATRPRNRLRSTFRSLGMLIGLASTEFLSDAEQLRNEAVEALRRRADALGANAVIGLQFFVSEGDDGSCEVVAFGQAVAVSKAEHA
ncbi:MAG TPA: heavy metal-binding domain-containing protein [Candidatus Dormibacteraeota bacterium]|nr:heavy metal-binding domain-containing protein [Candidatus Dormibacteraeota bacterium]